MWFYSLGILITFCPRKHNMACFVEPSCFTVFIYFCISYKFSILWQVWCAFCSASVLFLSWSYPGAILGFDLCRGLAPNRFSKSQCQFTYVYIQLTTTYWIWTKILEAFANMRYMFMLTSSCREKLSWGGLGVCSPRLFFCFLNIPKTMHQMKSISLNL